VDVHEFQFREFERLAGGGQIDRLAAGHAARAGSPGEQR
jgi:hypothetical protein